VTVKLQGFLEDRSVVEKDRKLVFVIGEADVIQVRFLLTLTWDIRSLAYQIATP
jgi:hypothetical protein